MTNLEIMAEMGRLAGELATAEKKLKEAQDLSDTLSLKVSESNRAWDVCNKNKDNAVEALYRFHTTDYTLKLGLDEGETCNRDGCKGKMELKDEGCNYCGRTDPCQRWEKHSTKCSECGDDGLGD